MWVNISWLKGKKSYWNKKNGMKHTAQKVNLSKIG